MELVITVEGLRNSKGLLRACLTRNPSHFPDCAADPAAVTGSAPAGQGKIVLQDVTPGTWAISVFHDENGNGKVDTTFGIPRDGVGFSRNPRLMFGPPRFAQVTVPVVGSENHQNVRLRYFL